MPQRKRRKSRIKKPFQYARDLNVIPDLERLKGGNLHIYQRAHTAKPIWYMRIRLPGHKGYVVKDKSTGTEDWETARRIAEDRYDDLWYRARQKIPLKPITFLQLFKLWLENDPKDRGAARQDSLMKTCRRYLLPFFGKHVVDQIDVNICAKYWGWRLDYWKSKSEAALKAENVKIFAETPSAATLHMEKQAFLQVMRWGQKHNHVTSIPSFDPPMKKPKPRDIRRPAFSYEEHIKLRNAATIRAAPKITPYQNAYGRHWLNAFVGVAFGTGMRLNELLSLKWKFVTEFGLGGRKYLEIYVPEETKTGWRWVVCMPDVRTDLWLWRKNKCRYVDPDDYIFATYDREKHKGPQKAFDRLMKDAELTHDPVTGDKRSIYSIRHTYITFRILYGKVSLPDLARNTGTSVRIIETHYDHVLNRQRAAELTEMVDVSASGVEREADIAEVLKQGYGGRGGRSGEFSSGAGSMWDSAF